MVSRVPSEDIHMTNSSTTSSTSIEIEVLSCVAINFRGFYSVLSYMENDLSAVTMVSRKGKFQLSPKILSNIENVILNPEVT